MQLFKDEINEMVDLERRNIKAWGYYDGGVPEFFATPQLRRFVRATVSNLGLNYSRVVVSEILNRLEVTAVLGGTAQQQRLLKQIDDTNQLDTFFDDLFEKVSIYGQALAMAWPDSEGQWRLSSHSPRNFYVKYNEESPWEMEYVLRIWQEDDQNMRMNVFYPDKIVKYAAKSMGLNDALNWQHMETNENPFGQIPCVHLRNNSSTGRPEHLDSYSMQDAINKLVINHLYTVDYQGAGQRYVLANADGSGNYPDLGDEDDAARTQIENLSADPGAVWYLKAVSAVGEFKPADPSVFWEPIMSYVRSMASITGTPLHYFESTGNMPSGQALRAAEAPLITKVKKRRNAYGLPLKRLFEFILRAERIAKPNVEIKWADLESMDVMEEWDLLLKKRNGGLPMHQILLEAGYTEEEITKIIEWKLAETQQLHDMEGYIRTAADGQQTYQRKPVVRVQENNDERNINND